MNLIEHGCPSNSGETGTPVDPGKPPGDELQRHSKIPGGAAGCRRAAGHCLSCDAACLFCVATCALSTLSNKSLSLGKIFRALNVQFNQPVEIAGLETTHLRILAFVHCTNITVRRPFSPNKTAI
ncbi:hypothetical protein BYI23_A008100 [Burkholderia sp. YI23]|uniref:hypothetical protein n=1 Tax=unclassified Caballeronia TaxID=2646786 RepID=UPI0002388EE3|nr:MULTISPECIES: hypothetical protein [unclassified Caballeronia]AET88648.1 hypothetical protein BYI23_A008100 [Burkholderia sp. YI23]MCE4542406.1 hypothetical protein [Caballeronia sp. PC1]MCE4568539.1 hypothetical protein [Caballeronia sp. CLC5]